MLTRTCLDPDLGDAPERREPLAKIWTRMISGEYAIVGHGETESHCCLELRRQERQQRILLTREQVRITEEVLVGRPQKSLAIDLKVSASTVSSNAARGLQSLGLSGCASRAPLGVVIAAASHRLKQRHGMPGWSARVVETQGGLEVRMSRPDPLLRPFLSAVEFEIVQLVLTGISHEEIAARRGRSERTVANQLHSIYAKLEVSGRFQLVHLAVALANSRKLQPRPSEKPVLPLLDPARSLLKMCASQIRFHAPLLDLLCMTARLEPSGLSAVSL